jgi:ribose transport system substrate-binding protein
MVILRLWMGSRDEDYPSRRGPSRLKEVKLDKRAQLRLQPRWPIVIALTALLAGCTTGATGTPTTSETATPSATPAVTGGSVPPTSASPSASSAAAACGQLVPSYPQDKSGVLAGLPAATLAGYVDYPITINASPYANFTPKHPKPWKIGFIDNHLGNYWHDIQVAQYLTTANAMKVAGLISVYTQVQSDDSIQTQIQQMTTFIQQGYDAIVMLPVSATGLNGEIDQARAAGVVVVTQDNPATTLSAINVLGNPILYGAQNAETLVQAMGPSGNVVMMEGIAGVPTDVYYTQGGKAVFANCPNIHVIQELRGNWDVATAKSVMLQFLTTHPGQVDGVWDSSGMAPGIIQAFQQVGRTVPVVTNGDPDIGYLAYWNANISNGFKGGAVALPPAGAADASMRVALKVLEGQGLKVSDIPSVVPEITAANLSSWVQPGWTFSTPGMTDQTAGKYLSDDILAPLFSNPAPTVP